MGGLATTLHIFISVILGTLAFAFIAAASTWWSRNRNDLVSRDPLPIFQVLLRFLALSGFCVVVILSARSLIPYQMHQAQGLLKSEDLFVVRALRGYEAEINGDSASVEQGQSVVTYTRRLSPTEEAEAKLERELIADRLGELRSEYATADPMDRLQKMSQVENFKAIRTQQEQERNQAMWELESMEFRLEEQEAKTNLARKEVAFAKEAVKNGLISKIEYDRRIENQKMEDARYNELKSRRDFAVESLIVMAPTASSIPGAGDSLSELLAESERRIADPSTMATSDLQYRLNQLDALLSPDNGSSKSIAVAAPWSGNIVYKNAARTSQITNEVIMVIAEKDAFYTEVLVPTKDANKLRESADVQLTNERLKELGIKLTGSIVRTESENSKQTLVEIRVPGRPELVKPLANGEEVKLVAMFVNTPPHWMYALVDNVLSLKLKDAALLLTALLLMLIASLRRKESKHIENRATTA